MATLRERAPGVWTLRVPNGTDPVDGKRVTITATFKGSEERAKIALALMVADRERGSREQLDHTLRQTINEWRGDANHATGTARNYDLAVESIPAHLLKTPIGKIRTATLNDLYKRVKTEHGVHRTRLVHAVISGALTYAWRQEWTSGNVARRVKPPSQPSRKTTTPSAAQLRQLLEAVADKPEIHAWLLLAAMTGCRRSELLALRWSDINLTSGELHVDKALDPVGGGVKTTKTEGHRVLAIGPQAVAALQRWHDAFTQRARSARGVRPVADPYVFTNALDGATPWRPDVATKRFRRLADKAGIDARLHDCRHVTATQMLAAGVPLKVIGDRLGHTRLSTTSDLYGDSIPASDRDAAVTLERILGVP